MDIEQITNISIQIGQLQKTIDYTLLAAMIACFGSIAAAIIAGITAYQVKEIEKKQQTQWAYIGRRSALIDSAIDICIRMIYNKLLLAYKIDETGATTNLFMLHKDALVVESQFMVYGSAELVDGIHDYVEYILNTPTDKFLERWSEIYTKGREFLLLYRKELGQGAIQKYSDFENKINDLSQFKPPSQEQVKTVKANTMGSVTIKS